MIRSVINLFLFFIFLIAGSINLYSQDVTRYFESEEETLKILFSKIQNAGNDSLRIILNDSVRDIIEYIVYDENSFDYTFDSIMRPGVIQSDDKLVRIYNWNLIMNNLTYRYFGFIQHRTETGDIDVFELVDNQELIINPEKQIFSNEDWPGALYYSIIENNDKRYKYYTLLGWDGNNEWSTKKIIDVLYFNSAGKPKFGANIFSVIKQGDQHKKIVKQKRVIFEYNSKLNMTLTYNNQLKMIVFDHLSPDQSRNSDDFRFYGPDWSYCGLKFKKGKWEYFEDIDPRNPKPVEKTKKWMYKKSEDVFSPGETINNNTNR